MAKGKWRISTGCLAVLCLSAISCGVSGHSTENVSDETAEIPNSTTADTEILDSSEETMLVTYGTGTAGPTVSTAAVTPTEPAVVHVVRSGDTLYGIAKSYGVTVEDLMEANGKDGTLIITGEELVIPSGGRMPDVSWPGPPEGSRLTVIGVDRSDVLNLRDSPNGDIIGHLSYMFLEWGGASAGEACQAGVDPLADHSVYATEDGTLSCVSILSTGESRRPVEVVWNHVSAGPIQGWVSDNFVGSVGKEDVAMTDMMQSLMVTGTTYPDEASMSAHVLEAISALQPEAEVVAVTYPPVIEHSPPYYFDVIKPYEDHAGYENPRHPVRGGRLELDVSSGGDMMAADESDRGPFEIHGVMAYLLCNVDGNGCF